MLHLSPRIAHWISTDLSLKCKPLRDLGLRDASDEDIFEKARAENAIMITKDQDFSDLVKRLGSPPKVIWLKCGNTSEERLKEILSKHLIDTFQVLHDTTEEIVEIRGD